jgi:hypothetical protein
MFLALATPSFAQARWPFRSQQYSRVNIDRLIRQAESRSNYFVNTFDRALDRSRLEGTFREDRLNVFAAQMERQLNLMRVHLNRTGNYNAMRSALANAMQSGERINTVMRNRRMGPVAERQWMLLRADLNRLAVAFNLRQIR